MKAHREKTHTLDQRCPKFFQRGPDLIFRKCLFILNSLYMIMIIFHLSWKQWPSTPLLQLAGRGHSMDHMARRSYRVVLPP